MRKACLIHNPAAGWFPTGPLLGRAVNVLARSGWDVEVREIEAGQDVGRLAKKSADAGCAAVFVAGGDGTVGRVAGVLAGTETALGVLPSGTANVWAQELGLPRLGWTNWFALEEAAAQLCHGDVRLVDIGEVNEHPFLMWAGIGLDAHIVNNIEPRARWEKTVATPHYAILAVWNARNWTGIELRVEAGGRVYEGRYLAAICSNIPTYAGGLLHLTPEAKVDDGLIDIWLIGGRSLSDAVLRVVQVLTGRHAAAPGMSHIRAGEARFESAGEIPMQFDGEPCLLRSPALLRVHTRSLRVLVPREGMPRFFSETTPSASEVS